MKRILTLAAVAGMALVAPASQAHHSFAMFDRTQSVTVSGTVRQFQWSNPHAYIQLEADDGVEWSLEMGSPMYLYARGWRPRSLRAGNVVTININPLRNGSPGGVVLDVTGADGRAIGTNQ